jgi:hypothetical protein
MDAPKRKIDEFSQCVIAESWANIRAETGL